MTRVSLKPDATTLAPEHVEALRARLRGELLLPGEPGYDEARTIWNAMIDRRPAGIVRAAGAADVVAAVNAARENGLLLSIRGGGHNIAGNAVADGGLMIDLTRMKSVRVDPAARTARVEPGVTLGEFDREAQAFGLATPLGINSTTGVAGLTLGGGFGWLSRKLGMSVDNLLSADVVIASGELVRASADQNADLFWALRGGGGNFGVVTSFEFRLHAVGPEVIAGLVLYPLAEAQRVLRGYRHLVASMPDELSVWFVLRKAPPLPVLPPEKHGTDIVALAICHAGTIEAGEKAAAPFRTLATPLVDLVGPHPYAVWQTALDPLLAAGARNYWKSNSFSELSDALIDTLISIAPTVPDGETDLACAQLGAATERVPADAMAYPHRDARWVLNVHGRWRDAAKDDACIAWAREVYRSTLPFATGGVYVNFLTDDESQRIREGAYGANYERLSRIKARYDAGNLFRMNQNIQPAP